MSSVGTVYLDVKFNSDQIGRDLGKSVNASASQAASALGTGIQGRLADISSTAYRAGRAMTIGLTVPLVAAGKVATNAFLPFERSLGKIEGLTGASTADMALYKSTIIETSSSFGVMAADAADALYFITSSGISGKAAIDTLNASMTGAAAGLGEVTTIADFATSVMNAYGQENVNAAQATDILTAAVRQGKAEPEDLASSIGQVIPIASQLSVSADQVAGSMAAITLNGTSAASASAQMTQVLTSLLGPSDEAKGVLANLGLSTTELAESLKNDGLIPTIEKITTGLDGNTEALDKVFGNVRALRGVLGLVGSDRATQKTLEIIDKTKNSLGDTQKAMDVMAQTAGFKLDQALSEINTSFIDIGDNVAPLAADFLKAANVGVKAFGSLPESVQATAVTLAGVAALAGPVTYGFAGITKAAEGLGKAGNFILDKRMQVFAATANGAWREVDILHSRNLKMAAGFGVVGAAIVGATVVMNAYQSSVQDTTSAIGNLIAAQQKGDKDSGVSAWDRLERDHERAKKLAAEAGKITGEGTDFLNIVKNPLIAKQNQDIGSGLADEALKVGAPAKKMKEQVLAIAESFGISRDKAAEFVVGQNDLGRSFETNDAAIEAYKAALGQTDTAQKQALTTLGSLIVQSKNASDAYFGLISANRQLDDAQLKVVDSQRAEGDAHRALVRAGRDQEAAQRAIVDAERRRAESALKVTDAIDAQRQAQERLDDLLSGNAAKSDELDLQSAEIALSDAKRRLSKGDFDKDDPNARKKAVIDVKRAEIALAIAQQQHAKNLAAAQRDVRDANAAVVDAQLAQEDAARQVIEAQLSYEDATYKSRDAQLAVERAVRDTQRAQEDLTVVAADLAGKQEAFSSALAGAQGQSPQFLEFLGKLKEAYPQVADSIQQAIDKFNEMAKNQPGQGTIAGSKIVQVPGRARGGPVSARHLYRVNETGKPELFESGGEQYLMPTSDGNVISADTWMGDVKGGDGGSYVGKIVVNGAQNPTATAYEIRRKMRSKGFMNGGTK